MCTDLQHVPGRTKARVRIPQNRNLIDAFDHTHVDTHHLSLRCGRCDEHGAANPWLRDLSIDKMASAAASLRGCTDGSTAGQIVSEPARRRKGGYRRRKRRCGSTRRDVGKTVASWRTRQIGWVIQSHSQRSCALSAETQRRDPARTKRGCLAIWYHLAG